MKKINSSKLIWKNKSLIKKIFDLFGHENIFFVGGAVRNALLNGNLEDLDLAVKINVGDVKKKLKKANIKFLDKSKGHGTVTILSKKYCIEITSMRKDKETYGRKAKVEFISDIFVDSCRRDFTINSIYSSYNGLLYDPHKGIDDLKNYTVKFIGDPKERIKEDHLRILRYFRFLSYYGCSLKLIDKDSLNATLQYFNLISNISLERKSYEFFKLLSGSKANEVLLLMKKKKILKTLMPGFENLKHSHLRVFRELENNKIIKISFLLILSNFKIKSLRQYLSISNLEFKKIKIICNNYYSVTIESSKEARLTKYKLGAEISKQVYYLQCFIRRKNSKKVVLKVFNQWDIPAFPINGNDLKKFGLNRGKTLGVVLQKTKEWWIEKDFKPDKRQCLSMTKLIISSSTGL